MGGFVRASSSGASLRGKLRGRATGASCGGAEKIHNRYTIVPAPLGIEPNTIKY